MSKRTPKKVLRWVAPGLHKQFRKAIREQDWGGALSYTDSERRISLCIDMMLAGIIDMNNGETPSVFATAVSDGDMPRQEYGMLYGFMSRCRDEGRRGFDGEAARKAFDELPEQVTIYRGTVEAEPDDKLGFCWSLDRDKAVWFATEHGRFRVTDSNPVILKATVKRDDIFALLVERDEQEVLIHPDYLGEVSITRIESSS